MTSALEGSMSSFDRGDPLIHALDELTALAGRQDRQALDALRGRLLDQRLRVLVAGEAKRGKSTLVNALLGRPVLPTGVTPLTALATTVRYGREESVTAVFPDRTEQFPLTALDDLVTERGNPGNSKKLVSVTAWLDAPLLARGVELVDTPGTGSVFEHNTAEAEAVLQTLDAAVVVLAADPAVSAAERDLMARVAALSVRMFVVLNKTDYLGHDQRAEVLTFTADVVAQATGCPARVYPMSALAGFTGQGNAGFAEFAADFSSYLGSGRVADLRYSVAGQAERIARSLDDEVMVARRAIELIASRQAEQVEAFARRLEAAAEQRDLAADVAAADSRRMLATVNDAAERAVRESAATVSAQLAELLDTELRSAWPAEVERTGRKRLAEMAVAQAEGFRRGQAASLESGLARLDERLTADLASEYEGVRLAAKQLLGVELAASGPSERLAPDLRFFYQVADRAGQTELLAGAVRRGLPGELGRSRARAYLRRETQALVPQQIGRARADLQYRLAEAVRHLTADAQARYDQAIGRLEQALADASRLSSANSQDLAARDKELAERHAALDIPIHMLDSVRKQMRLSRAG
jgi:small GTP-binding protein